MRTLSLTLLALTLAACGGAPGQPGRSPARESVPPYQPGVVPDSFVVRLATTKGNIDVLLRRDWAPHGTERFYDAVSQNVYDGARFFRTIRGFVAQFGIAADPAVSAEWMQRRIPDDPVLQSNRRGTLVFAAGSDPDTRSAQLFFNLRNNARLDAMRFAPIGEVIKGIDAMDSLYTGYGDGANAPNQGRAMREGEAYFAAEFPLLDRIDSAFVIRAWMPRPPEAP